MKKIALTIAIVLEMTVGAMAQQYGGGLFERGNVSDEVYYGSGSYYDDYFSNLRNGLINLPNEFGNNGDFNGETGNAPLGGGVLVLIGLSAAYAVSSKRREKN